MYKKGKSGLSLYTGAYLTSIKGVVIGADVTLGGYMSLGISRSFIGYQKSISNFNVGLALLKNENERRTITLPLIASFTTSGERDLFSVGAGIATRIQESKSRTLTPVFVVLRQFENIYNKSWAFGLELNFMMNKLRIAPGFAFSNDNVVISVVTGVTL